MPELLLAKLNKINPLSSNFQNYISQNLGHYSYIPGDHVLFRQPLTNTVYFIASGTVSGISMMNDKKTTVWFAVKDHFIIPTFHQSEKQFLTHLEFVTPSQLLTLEFDMIFHAIEHFPEALLLFKGIVAQHIYEANSREAILRMPSNKRYSSTLEQIPSLLNDCHAEQLASYLAMSLSTLMRIKRAAARGKRKNDK